MFNDKPCGTCKFYDPIMKGAPKGGLVKTRRGWCMKYSLYPHKEGPGQKFPSDVTRVKEGERAKPKIVKNTEVVSNCEYYSERTQAADQQALIRKVQAKDGRLR